MHACYSLYISVLQPSFQQPVELWQRLVAFCPVFCALSFLLLSYVPCFCSATYLQQLHFHPSAQPGETQAAKQPCWSSVWTAVFIYLFSYLMLCCLFFFSPFPAGVNEGDSLQHLASSCTGSEEQQRRNAPSCWYSEGGDRMARCLPQVDGNRSSKCPCACP